MVIGRGITKERGKGKGAPKVEHSLTPLVFSLSVGVGVGISATRPNPEVVNFGVGIVMYPF